MPSPPGLEGTLTHRHCLLTLLCLSATTGYGAIPNRSFEEADPANTKRPANWNLRITEKLRPHGSIAYVDDRAMARDRARCVFVEGKTVEFWADCYTRVPIKPGTAYRASYWARTANLTGKGAGVQLYVAQLDENGRAVHGRRTPLVTPEGGWRKWAYRVVTKPDAKHLFFALTLKGKGRCWFDGASLTEERIDDGPGAMLWQDDFSDSAAMDLYEDRGGGWQIQGGVLRQTRTKGTRSLSVSDPRWRDAVVEFRVRPLAEDADRPGGWAGVQFRGVAFFARASNLQAVHHKSRKSFLVELPRNLGKWNQLRMMAVGRRLSFYVNGEHKWGCETEEDRGGVSIVTSILSAEFDDLRIYRPRDVEAGEAVTMVSSGRNIIANGSFEYVHDGIPDCWTGGGFDAYGSLETFWESWGAVSAKDAPHGETVLRVKAHPARRTRQIPYDVFGDFSQTIWRYRTVKGPHVLSVYLKSDPPGVPVDLWAWSSKINVFRAKPTAEWRRYEFAVDLKKPEVRVSALIRGEGTLWLDGIQFETGTQATEYVDNLPAEAKMEKGKLKEQKQYPDLDLTRASSPIVVDGRLDESAWTGPQSTGPFHSWGRPLSQRTEARVLYDEHNLYAGFSCEEREPDKIKATVENRDGGIAADDSVEIFLDANDDRSTYYYLTFNTIGTQTDGRGFDFSWNASWQCATHIDKDGWTAEAAIPLASLGIDNVTSQRWGINLARGNPRAKEYSCFAPTQFMNFHDVANFAYLHWPGREAFAQYLIDVREVRLVQSLDEAGKGAFVGTVVNDSPRPRTLRLEVALDKDNRVTSGDVRLEKGEEAKLRVPGLAIKPGEEYSVQLTVHDAETNELVARRERFVTAQSAIGVYLDRSYYSKGAEAQVHGACNLEAALARTARAALSLQRGGKDVWSGTFRVGDRTVWSVPLDGLPNDTYELTGELIVGQRRVALPSQALVKVAPIAKNETKLDHVRRCLLLDGEPYLPFSPLLGGYRRPSPEYLAQFAKAGFTDVTLSYAKTYRDQIEPTFKEASDLGLKCFFWPVWTANPTNLAYLREHLPTLKNLPGLIGNWVVDEPWDHPERVIEQVNVTRAIDPNHVVLVNHHIPCILSRFAGLPGDVISTDHYVIPPVHRKLKNITHYVREFEKIAEPRRLPTWFWVSGTSANHEREPTGAEQECQCYQAIAAGCTGLFFFYGNFRSRGNWEALIRIKRELDVLSPAVFSLQPRPHIRVNSKDITVTAREHDGSYYVIAVNSIPRRIDAAFDLSSLSIPSDATAEVMFERREVRVLRGIMRDVFEPYRRHVYRLPISH